MYVAKMQATRCAICGTEDAAIERYPANFDDDAFTTAVFSARRLPDRIRYRIVQCRTCGLVRSDPIADPALLTRLYERSTFDYGDEVAGLRATYGRYLRMLAHNGAHTGALLEIGCGNGFMLEEALAQGYREVRGAEPSAEAISHASPRVRSAIVRDVMHAGLFAPASFDAICLFQVFDHIPDPGTLLDQCLDVLKPGGFVLCLNHNIAAVSARLLKERSPIIDIEHTYLYSPTTMARIFRDHGFDIVRTGAVRNTYALHYLTRLMPLPASLKRPLLHWLSTYRIGRLPLSVPLGNMYLIARKAA